jgi:hypothetical protein
MEIGKEIKEITKQRKIDFRPPQLKMRRAQLATFPPCLFGG